MFKSLQKTNFQYVHLTKDSLNVPLELLWKIGYDNQNPSRPSLMPLFRILHTPDIVKSDDISTAYQELRSQLNPDLQEQLQNDERLPFEERDPDLMALDMSLKFEAQVMTLTRLFATPLSPDRDPVIAAKFQAAIQETFNQTGLTGKELAAQLEEHLQQIGSNDPSYDHFSGILNVMHDVLDL
jgi:hypothetical protein